jgi:hypothetical protein
MFTPPTRSKEPSDYLTVPLRIALGLSFLFPWPIAWVFSGLSDRNGSIKILASPASMRNAEWPCHVCFSNRPPAPAASRDNGWSGYLTGKNSTQGGDQ